MFPNRDNGAESDQPRQECRDYDWGPFVRLGNVGLQARSWDRGMKSTTIDLPLAMLTLLPSESSPFA